MAGQWIAVEWWEKRKRSEKMIFKWERSKRSRKNKIRN